MKTFNEKISEVAFHLQSLSASEFSPEIRAAVERKDKNSLVKLCRKAQIPTKYLGTIVSVLLSVSPNQKWPPVF